MLRRITVKQWNERRYQPPLIDGGNCLRRATAHALVAGAQEAPDIAHGLFVAERGERRQNLIDRRLIGFGHCYSGDRSPGDLALGQCLEPLAIPGDTREGAFPQVVEEDLGGAGVAEHLDGGEASGRIFVLQHRQYRRHGILAGDQCGYCDAAHRFITIPQSSGDTLRRPTSSRRQLIADYSSCLVSRADQFLKQVLR